LLPGGKFTAICRSCDFRWRSLESCHRNVWRGLASYRLVRAQFTIRVAGSRFRAK